MTPMLCDSFCCIPAAVVLKTDNAFGKRVKLALVVGPTNALVKICGLVIVGLLENTRLPVPEVPVAVTPWIENCPDNAKLTQLNVPLPGLYVSGLVVVS